MSPTRHRVSATLRTTCSLPVSRPEQLEALFNSNVET